MNRNKVDIRVAEPGDVISILEIYTPFVLETPATFEETVPSQVEMKDRIASILEQYPFLVCEVNGKIAGYAYATRHRTREAYRWSVESSVYVHPGFYRKKIGLALYSSLIEILLHQGITIVLAGITLPNPPSVSFHESMGFRKVAHYNAIGFKLGKWQNVGWWELSLNPGNKPPLNQLVTFPEIRKSNFFLVAITKGLYKISL